MVGVTEKMVLLLELILLTESVAFPVLVMVNELVREAKSIEGFIDEHSDIEVVSVEGTRIVVKPVKA